MPCCCLCCSLCCYLLLPVIISKSFTFFSLAWLTDLFIGSEIWLIKAFKPLTNQNIHAKCFNGLFFTILLFVLMMFFTVLLFSNSSMSIEGGMGVRFIGSILLNVPFFFFWFFNGLWCLFNVNLRPWISDLFIASEFFIGSDLSIYWWFLSSHLFIDSSIVAVLFCLYLVITYFLKLFTLYLFKTW